MFGQRLNPSAGSEAERVAARLAAALSGAPIWVFEQDASLRYTWLENADTAGNAGGVTDRDLMERLDEAEQVEAIKARVLTTGTPESHELVAHVGGRPRRHRLTVAPTRDAKGQVRGLIGTTLDLGPAEPPEDRGALLRLLGHELRNAVNPVRIALQFMIRRAGEAGAGASLTAAFAGVERLTAALEDMLEHARGSTESIPLELRPVALDGLFDRVLERFRVLHPDAVSRLTVLPAGPEAAALANEKRLGQALGALLDRAARTVGRDGELRLSGTAEGEAVEIEVEDEGAPLPSLDPTTLEDPVAWAQRCLAGHRDEPPFAFAVVGSLIRAMQGEVTVTAGAGGRGTRVRLRLPRAAPVEASSSEAATIPAPRRILVVDDSPGATATLARLLEIDGHVVHQAQSGAACLAALAEGRFDAVILDLGLPDVDGQEIARRIRARPGPHPHLVALTGRSGERDRRDSLEAGFDRFLVKPVDLAGLRRALPPEP